MQLKGPLRICIPNEIGPALLGSVVADFACQYPDLEISCVTNLSGFESLRDDLDLAIIVSRGQMDDSDYIARHLVNRVNSGEMAGRAAVAGVGFAILSKQACQPYINDGRLIEVEFEQSPAPLQLFALYSGRRYLPAKTRALIDFIHQRLSHIPSPDCG